MVGTWTYTVATNLITVTGGTAIAPCTFLDAWTADKAGTYNIVATRNIVAADGAPVPVTNALRPADYIMLGLADLYLTVTNYILPSTVTLVGTDYLGNAVTEDIAITADGTYNTTKFYKTVTSTQVTVYGDSFTYKMDQGQWGVVWKQGTSQYAFDGRLMIGDDATATYFADVSKTIILNDGCLQAAGQYCIDLRTNSHFRAGVALDTTNKITSQGCTFISLESRNDIVLGQWLKNFLLELYGCMFIKVVTTTTSYIQGGVAHESTNKIWNCNFYVVAPAVLTADFFNVIITKHLYYGDLICQGTFDTLYIDNCAIAALYNNLGIAVTFKNIKLRNNAKLLVLQNANSIAYLINCVSDAWTFSFNHATQIAYRQYEFDLKVTDKDNAAINAATVTLKDKDGNVVFTVNTAADGTIAQQTVSRGYYNQANGNTLQEYSPHNLTITKVGYITYDQDFTLDQKTEWEIVLHTQLAGTADVGDVVLGETFYSDDADTPLTGTYIIPVLTGNANPPDVLLSKTFYKDDATNKLTGTLILPITGGGGHVGAVPSPAQDILITATGHLLLNLNRNKPIYLEIE